MSREPRTGAGVKLVWTGIVVLRGLLAQEAGRIFLVFVLVILGGELTLTVAALSGRVINSFAGGGVEPPPMRPLGRWLVDLADGSRVSALVGLLLGALILNEGLRLAGDMVRSRSSLRFRLGLQQRLVEAMAWTRGEARVDREESTDQSIYLQDASRAGEFLLFAAGGFLEAAVRAGIYVWGMSQLASGRGWLLAAIAVPLVVGAHLLVAAGFRRREEDSVVASDMARLRHQKKAQRFFEVLDRIVGAGGEKKLAPDLFEDAERSGQSGLALHRVSTLRGSVASSVSILAVPLVLLMAVWLEVGSPGEVFQLQMITLPLLGAISALMGFPSTVIAAAPMMGRVLETLRQPRPEHPLAVNGTVDRLAHSQGLSVRMEGIEFRYPGADRSILTDVCLELREGSVVCLAGRSGEAGKSTLARIMAGSLVPDAGRIVLDGVEVTDLPLWFRRRLVGYVPADAGFIPGSLRDNVVFGREGIDDETVERALRASHLEAKAAELGNQEIEDPARQLSSGERGRVGVARLLCGSQPVRIFDEPTSGLDGSTAAAVAVELVRMLVGTTAILITHEPHLFPGLEILFLAEGRIQDRGKHEELMARNSAYGTMVAGADSGCHKPDVSH